MPSNEQPLRPVILVPGMRINNRYVVERELGRGGFAATYLATDELLYRRLVVVKVLSQLPSLDGWYHRKFTDEIRALSLVDHPGVVTPIDSGRLEGNTPFLVMQFVDGFTLRALMRERVSVKRAAGIVQQCGRALAGVHAKRIYHRDLKPENIMVRQLSDGSDHVLLIDFGIASVLESSCNSAVQTRVVGSLLYMAPEQFNGISVRQTDVFGLAAVTYEMLCGIPPFPADDMMQLLESHRQWKIVSPRALRPRLTKEAERLLLQALAPEPEERPNDVAEWANCLAAALYDNVRAKESWRRVGLTRASVAVAIPTICIGAALYWPSASSVAPSAGRAVDTPDKEVASFTAGIAVRVGVVQVRGDQVRLRAGDEFRINISTAQDGHIYIYSEDLDSGSLTALFPSTSANGGSSFVPPGRNITIPESRYLQFGDKPGRDRLWLVWASKPHSTLAEGSRWIGKAMAGRVADRHRAASIRQVLANARVEAEPHGNLFRVNGSSDPLISAIIIEH